MQWLMGIRLKSVAIVYYTLPILCLSAGGIESVD